MQNAKIKNLKNNFPIKVIGLWHKRMGKTAVAGMVIFGLSLTAAYAIFFLVAQSMGLELGDLFSDAIDVFQIVWTMKFRAFFQTPCQPGNISTSPNCTSRRERDAHLRNEGNHVRVSLN